ncbi:MAG: hypothetical protein ACI8RZ_004280 [Myxococcota bacterium]
MKPTTLSTVLNLFLPADVIRERDQQLGGQQRQRKRDVVALVRSLVLSSGSDDSGRQADVFSSHLLSANTPVSRSGFYAWFTMPLAFLLSYILEDALNTVRALNPVLTGALAGMKDWRAVDSETVTLLPPLLSFFPATKKRAGLKIHKTDSFGRNNMVDFHLSPARRHDSSQLTIDETWRGMGLLIDLGYASIQRIRHCKRYDVGLILRLKKGWKPSLLAMVDLSGERVELAGKPVSTSLLEMPSGRYSRPYDFDVAFGQGRNRVTARLVGVPVEDGFHWCITLLERSCYPPALVSQLYRVRWGIECDNRQEKGAARLDQLRARCLSSVLVLVFASLLRNLISNHLVYLDLTQRCAKQAPLHGFAVSLAMNTASSLILWALKADVEELWSPITAMLSIRGRDPNWRGRPSQLDQLRQTTALPGRPRTVPLRRAPPQARPFRRKDIHSEKRQMANGLIAD